MASNRVPMYFFSDINSKCIFYSGQPITFPKLYLRPVVETVVGVLNMKIKNTPNEWINESSVIKLNLCT